MEIKEGFEIHLDKRFGSFFRGVYLKCENGKYFWEMNKQQFKLKDEILAGITIFHNFIISNICTKYTMLLTFPVDKSCPLHPYSIENFVCMNKKNGDSQYMFRFMPQTLVF